jgi:hypothetical protein
LPSSPDYGEIATGYDVPQRTMSIARNLMRVDRDGQSAVSRSWQVVCMGLPRNDVRAGRVSEEAQRVGAQVMNSMRQVRDGEFGDSRSILNVEPRAGDAAKLRLGLGAPKRAREIDVVKASKVGELLKAGSFWGRRDGRGLCPLFLRWSHAST